MDLDASEEPYELSIKYKMNYGNKSDIKVSNTDVLYNVLKRNSVMDNVASQYVSSETGIDFSQISSNTNGRGLYMMADTKDNQYPIMYYRGNVDNNNVIFGGYCWQIVRTTETGGIKLIYNGTPTDTYEKTILSEEQYNIINNNGFTYDKDSGYWKLTTSYTTGELSFMVPEHGNYIIDVLGYAGSVAGTYAITNGSTSLLSGTLNPYNSLINNEEVGALMSTNTVTLNLTGTGWQYFYVRLIQKGDLIGTGCDNIGDSTYVKLSSFNKKINSIAYNGYMYNNVYECVDEVPIENAYFGSDVTYVNGVYQLSNAEVGYTSSRHYTCNSTDSAATCESVRYYINDGSYVELVSGKMIADAVSEMTNDSNINKTDSNTKIELENWYSNNLLNYANNIEDTIWCGDRSIYYYGAFSTTGSDTLFYKAYSRATTKNIILKCENEVDNFSLENNLATINYPIGLLTVDETRLAGANFNGVNNNYYLQSKTYSWTMSPAYFDHTIFGANVFNVYAEGTLSHSDVSYGSGLRPSISLTKGTIFIDGDGTKGHPYVINTY